MYIYIYVPFKNFLCKILENSGKNMSKTSKTESGQGLKFSGVFLGLGKLRDLSRLNDLGNTKYHYGVLAADKSYVTHNNNHNSKNEFLKPKPQSSMAISYVIPK